MTFRPLAALALSAALLSAACSGAGVTGPAATRSEALTSALRAQPEMADAMARIDGGRCRQVLPMLTVYAGQDERSQLLDYLLGRAYVCNGDWTKGCFHLRRAWQAGKELRPDIRTTARQAAEALGVQFENSGGLAYPVAKAAAGFFAFGEASWHSPQAIALLLAFFEKQLARGEYAGALRTVTVLKRIGAPPSISFEPEALARIRLGQKAEIEALFAAQMDALAGARGETLYRLGGAAEAAFRHDIAAWFYGQCRQYDCPSAAVGQDLTRALLKAGRPDEAKIEYQDYLATTPREQVAERALAVAGLLQRHDRLDEAYDVLAGAIKLQPTSFPLARAAAALHEKLPGKVNVTALFSGFLKANASSRDALIQVGDQCLEWRLPNAGLPLLPGVADTPDGDLVYFYRGAFQWLSGRPDKADDAFSAAVKSAPSKAEMLGRIAAFFLGTGDARQARAFFEKALKEDPQSREIILKLATLLEEEKTGAGLKMLKKRVHRKASARNAMAAATWCSDRGDAANALEFARQAVTNATGDDAGKAHLLLGRFLLKKGDEAAALEAFEQAFAATDPALVAAEVFAVDWQSASNRVACFIATHAIALNRAGKLLPGQTETGALASIRCKNPDVPLLQSYLATANNAAQAYLTLFGAVDSQAGRLALAALESSWPVQTAMSSPLLEQLVLLFASLRDQERALKYAQTLVRVGGAARRDQYAALAARILPQGQTDAARELLRSAFEFGYAASGGTGSEHAVTYAGLLFANGEDDAGMVVLRRMLNGGFDPGDAVAAGTLLVDAGKFSLAYTLALEALTRFAEVREEPVGLPGEDERPMDPRKLSRADLMALLQKRPALEPGEARRQLVGLAAYAWQKQGLPWADFLTQMRKAVRPFNGENYLAAALHRLDATQPALKLLADAFGDAPGELQLFKAYCDALVYADYVKDNAINESASQLEGVAKRFVKAREGDADAYRVAAAYLEGKGMFKAAASLLSDLADATSVDAKMALALARNQLSQGRSEEAATHFSLASQLSACNRKIVDPIMAELERVARLDLAVDIVRECARRFPKDAYLHLLYGRLLLDGAGGTPEDGTVSSRLQKAVSLDKSLLGDAVGLLHARQRGEEAWPLLEAMTRSKNPEDAVKALEIGFEIASATGDVDRMTRLGSLASRNHRDPQVASELAGVYFKYNLPDQGLAKLKASEGQDDVSSLLLGIRMITNGDAKGGLKRLRAHADKTFAGRKPDSGPMDAKEFKPLSVQLDFLEDMGLDGESIALLKRALSVFPEDARLRLRLMERLTVAQKFSEVEPMVARVVREWPGGEERKRLVRVLERFRNAGRLGELRRHLVASCPSLAQEGCLLPSLIAAAMEGDAAGTRELVDAALGSALPAIRLADLGDELATLGFFGEAEELLTASLSRTVGRPTPVLVQVHRLLARIYSATDRRSQIDELNRLFLLHPATRAELRAELPENLVDYEYLDAALQQYGLLALTLPDGLKAELAAFDVLIRKQDFVAARSLALRSAFRAENVLNGLLTYASLARRKLVFDIALELYQAAQNLDPTNRALLFALAELELVQGQTAAAITHFETYVGEGPGRDGRRVEVVRNLTKYNKLGLAATLAEKAGTEDTLVEAALGLLRAGQKSEAVRLLNLAYTTAGRDPASVGRRVLFFALNRPHLLPDATISRAMKAACTGATVPAICRFWDGLTMLEKGQVKEAVKRFDSQLAGTSETWPFTLAAVRALVRKGADQPAEALLSKRMIGFNEVQVLNEAVKTVFALFEEEALDDAGRASALSLGERLVDRLLEQAPYDFWFRTQKAELLLMAGEGPRALKLYEKYLSQTSWDPGLYNNLAYLLSKLPQDLERALTLVSRALAHEASHSAFYLDTQGWVLFRLGRKEEAEGLILAALLRSHLGFGDSLAESLYHLGTVMLANNKGPQGLRYLTVAGFIDPYGKYGRLAREVLVEQGIDVYGLKTP